MKRFLISFLLVQGRACLKPSLFYSYNKKPGKALQRILAVFLSIMQSIQSVKKMFINVYFVLVVAFISNYL